MFPEGDNEGLYHTADATLWFFHAVWRYARATDDRDTLRMLIPKLLDIVDHHLRGTLFNIRVDPADGLLSQGAEGYQLTWMDAKVDDWVVTPRRGKAVEINALWYNALRILEKLLLQEGDEANALQMAEHANRAANVVQRALLVRRRSISLRCGRCRERGNDAALRPNQIFAVSLDHPVLDESRWRRVVDVVKDELLTPVGLRSLARPSRLQAGIRRRPPRARRRLSPGHGLGLADRPVHRRLAESASGRRRNRPALPERLPRRARRSLHRHDQRSLRRRAAVHIRGDVWPRPGAWPRCCGRCERWRGNLSYRDAPSPCSTAVATPTASFVVDLTRYMAASA